MSVILAVSLTLCIALILILVFYFGEGRFDLKNARKEFEIFGLSDGFVPQGIYYSKNLSCFLISGYMKNKSLPSRVYVVDEKTGRLIKFVSFTFLRKKICGHFGGIAGFGENIWISSDGEVFRVSVEKIKNAKDAEKIEILDKFSSKNRADYIFVDSGMLWVGEYYKLGKFKTKLSHHILFSGEQFHAMCFGFKISPQKKFGIESNVPEKALAVPDLVQGVSVTRNEIFLSCSYALKKSNVLVFENVLRQSESFVTIIDEQKIPVFVLTKKHFKRVYVFPSMSEEIEIVDGRLFILFENASKKYKFFTRRKIKNIYSIEMNK